jgi:methylated-DNA-[protein]-cysteine S-methyltransferase
MPHATFATPFGECALVWSAAGVAAFALPTSPLREPLAARNTPRDPSPGPATPPPWVGELIARVQRHLAGTPEDFADVRYDFASVSAFNIRVLRATLAVKSGRTATYGEIAAALGEPPAASRAVGAALGANRCPLLIPCHRITGAHGRMTGFSGPGGVETKARLLALEGACLL